MYTAGMHSRGLRILMLAFVTLWFGMVLPGHERGAIKLPGYAKAGSGCETASSCHSCCPTEGGKKDSSRRSDSRHCAICYLIGVLDLPVQIEFVLPDPQLLDSLSPAMLQSIASVTSLDAACERGPPKA